MKLLFSIFFFAIHVSYCQNSFDSKIKAVTETPEECFRKFRGAFKKIVESDSIFNSAILIDGTKDNEIILSGPRCMYMATIIDSAGDKHAKKVINNWKNELLSFLGDKWQLKKLEIVEWNPAVYGWRFVYNNITISITQYPEIFLKSFIVKFGVDSFGNAN